MEKYAADIGYSGCSLVLGRMPADTIESPTIKSNFSNEFRSAYADQGLGQIDPFLLFGCETLSAKQITTSDLTSFPRATRIHQNFLDLAYENGASNNLGIPVRQRGPEQFGGWILSNTDTSEQYAKLLTEHSSQVHLASVLAFERMVAIGLGSSGQERLLSGRERECLLWLCAGLRVTKIAGKLSISESAVNLYLSNARKKLGAQT
ncbi:MAG: LuxR C-terminal-related transcriptional regulator, partial [Anderseniella sp.]